jgi:hypothetical protein
MTALLSIRGITPFRYYYRMDATPNQNCMRYLIRVKQITNLGRFTWCWCLCIRYSGQHRPGIEKFRMTVGLVLWFFSLKIKYSEYKNSCHQNSIGLIASFRILNIQPVCLGRRPKYISASLLPCGHTLFLHF